MITGTGLEFIFNCPDHMEYENKEITIKPA